MKRQYNFKVSMHTPNGGTIETEVPTINEVAQLLHGVKGTFFVFHYPDDGGCKMTYHSRVFNSWDGDEVEEIREAIKQLD